MTDSDPRPPYRDRPGHRPGDTPDALRREALDDDERDRDRDEHTRDPEAEPREP